MADPPLPHCSQRIQEIREMIREELDEHGSLSLIDRNLPLCHSRRDTPIPFTHIDLEHPFVHRRMNLETSQPFSPVTCDKEISTSHPIVGESLPSSFPYVLTNPADTNPTMSSSISTTMASSTPPPSTYPITSNSVLSSP